MRASPRADRTAPTAAPPQPLSHFPISVPKERRSHRSTFACQEVCLPSPITSLSKLQDNPPKPASPLPPHQPPNPGVRTLYGSPSPTLPFPPEPRWNSPHRSQPAQISAWVEILVLMLFLWVGGTLWRYSLPACSVAQHSSALNPLSSSPDRWKKPLWQSTRDDGWLRNASRLCLMLLPSKKNRRLWLIPQCKTDRKSTGRGKPFHAAAPTVPVPRRLGAELAWPWAISLPRLAPVLPAPK